MSPSPPRPRSFSLVLKTPPPLDLEQAIIGLNPSWLGVNSNERHYRFSSPETRDRAAQLCSSSKTSFEIKDPQTSYGITVIPFDQSDAGIAAALTLLSNNSSRTNTLDSPNSSRRLFADFPSLPTLFAAINNPTLQAAGQVALTIRTQTLLADQTLHVRGLPFYNPLNFPSFRAALSTIFLNCGIVVYNARSGSREWTGASIFFPSK